MIVHQLSFRHTELASELAIEARRKSGTEGDVRIFGCLPPICESHNPELFFKYLGDNGEDFVRDTYREEVSRGYSTEKIINPT